MTYELKNRLYAINQAVSGSIILLAGLGTVAKVYQGSRSQFAFTLLFFTCVVGLMKVLTLWFQHNREFLNFSDGTS